MSQNKNSEALFHLTVKTFKRSENKSILVAISYRAACLMRGENGNVVADYRRRKGVLHSQIIAPVGAPAWAKKRQLLWLAAAKKETRKNSVEAREFEVAIPAGLSKSEAITMVEKFSNELVEKHKFVVDFSLHADSRTDWTGAKKNFDGYHAHITVTTRRINEDGFYEKTRELDEKRSGLILFWRRRWAELANDFLERAGSEKRIDHRSHKDRGILRLPTIHLGPVITALERKGIRTRVGDYTRALLKSFVIGVQERELNKFNSIDTITTVTQALAERNKVDSARKRLEDSAKKALLDMEFEQAINRISIEFNSSEIASKNEKSIRNKFSIGGVS